MRWKAHDSCVFNAHTSKPDRGEFLGYNKCPKGYGRVLLSRQGFISVPIVALTKTKEK